MTITITDVNEAPAVTGDATATFDEDTAMKPQRCTPTLRSTRRPTLLSPGRWRAPTVPSSPPMVVRSCSRLKPDFEMPTDANGDNVYEVTVVATAAARPA